MHDLKNGTEYNFRKNNNCVFVVWRYLFHFYDFISEFCERYQQDTNQIKMEDYPSNTDISTTCMQVVGRKNLCGFSTAKTKKRGRGRKMPSLEEVFETNADVALLGNTMEIDRVESEANAACTNILDEFQHPVEETVSYVKQRKTRRNRVITENLKSFTETDILNKHSDNEEDNNFEIDYGIFEDGVVDPPFTAKKIEQDKEEHSFACKECSFMTQQLMEFNDHSLEHSYTDKKCSHCDYEFSHQDVSMELFRKHVDNHLTAEGVVCNFCSKKFSRKSVFSRHLRKHSRLKQFSCKVCGASFKWKHVMTAHMITHKKTKEHLCDVCGFATAHKYALKAHYLIHTGDTFKCQKEGCTFETHVRSNLTNHMVRHSNMYAYHCEICGTNFTLEKNLKRHMLMHKAVKSFQCEKCKYYTTSDDKLMTHYYNRHGIRVKPGEKLKATEYKKKEIKPKKKYRVTLEPEEKKLEENIVEEPVMQLNKGQETIDIEVVGSENVTETAQIVNVQNVVRNVLVPANVQRVVVMHKDGVAYEVSTHKSS